MLVGQCSPTLQSRFSDTSLKGFKSGDCTGQDIIESNSAVILEMIVTQLGRMTDGLLPTEGD